MPSVKALEAKKQVVDEIKNKLNDSKTVVLFNYHGLTDNDSKELRIKLKDSGSDYKIYKNTLLKLALKDMNIDLDNYLEGPTAIVFSSDDLEAIKVLSKFAKTHKTLELKAGVVEGNVADTNKLKEFAAIPSREGLYTMLAGGMIAIVKDLSIALNLLAEQKEN
ncbi:MAG: 50S ribosomal protein L10 [bacterium]|nr:50S ribosomal protein L10 [bacterium]